MRKLHAFTLIELMVVVAIIAMLASLSIPALSRSVQKGRDAQQKSDISAVQQALVAYRADKGSYPSGSYANLTGELDTEGFISKVPSPTKAGASYTYTPTCSGTCKTFILCTSELEFKSKSNGNSTDTSGTPCSADEDCKYWCVTNP